MPHFKNKLHQEKSQHFKKLLYGEPPSEKCATTVIMTGEHCPEEPKHTLFGVRLCDKCYEAITGYNKELNERKTKSISI